MSSRIFFTLVLHCYWNHKDMLKLGYLEIVCRCIGEILEKSYNHILTILLQISICATYLDTAGSIAIGKV